ncbi:FxsB family cyclophane-forming radical SAM/SPASM peptide maturase [Actinoplanes sp. L3-i22]|uniref:FxsB family cyclophane-forming radical SAM/SPASM peptide maturase n=1 Tax=Actinoplanes sp. L3-i22 TaxID=2836373 RepID=UPI001C7834C7|nr:FxsB family cyclophane-forming radical SAM/SPASM peptide maturase [Actinoplanes sp. L3-i22]BCY13151.1 radical SAM protein [Actinoplanes sp. L3-i22]
MPDTVRQIVLKVHSRCNLSCTYCYVYHSVDDSWKRQPLTIDAATSARIGERVREHVLRHRPPSLSIVLHGGEPLLAGPDRTAALLRELRDAVPAGTRVRFGMQTNGILLDQRFLEIFHEFGVRVGVSLDGGRAANRHRVYANGRDSYDQTATGLRLLARPEHRAVYSGLLCTIDVRNDPVQTYRDLLAFEPPLIDLLLPHGNWTNPPPRPAGAMSYADWLIAIFDDWYGGPELRTRIRLFESIMMRLLGGHSATEAIGGDQTGVVVIETDGSYEATDSLRTTENGAAATGLSVLTDSLDDVLALVDTPSPLGAQCLQCPVVAVCGGGLRAHRFRDGSYDNPSAYCDDLYALIRHIQSRVTADLRVAR